AALLAGERGTLRIGIMQSVGTKVLPQLLRRFREESPGIALEAEETVSYDELTRGVESGRFDLSFSPLPVTEGPFAVRRVLDDPFVCLAPADAPESESGTVSLRQAARRPLIGFSDPELHDELVRRLRRTGEEPSFVFRSNDNPTVQGCVAAGLGYAIMPRLTVDEDDPHVSVLTLSPPVPPRQLGVVWHVDRQLPATAARFVDLAAQVCIDLAVEWSQR
ncbi:MAG: LysR family transcriptional regulator substrate-binding protein, partial [Actinomycetes bacterium]